MVINGDIYGWILMINGDIYGLIWFNTWDNTLIYCDIFMVYGEFGVWITLWFHQTWLENPLWMEVLVGKSPVNGPFSIAMFDYRRVCWRMEIKFSWKSWKSDGFLRDWYWISWTLNWFLMDFWGIDTRYTGFKTWTKGFKGMPSSQLQYLQRLQWFSQQPPWLGS